MRGTLVRAKIPDTVNRLISPKAHSRVLEQPASCATQPRQHNDRISLRDVAHLLTGIQSSAQRLPRALRAFFALFPRTGTPAHDRRTIKLRSVKMLQAIAEPSTDSHYRMPPNWLR